MTTRSLPRAAACSAPAFAVGLLSNLLNGQLGRRRIERIAGAVLIGSGCGSPSN